MTDQERLDWLEEIASEVEVTIRPLSGGDSDGGFEIKLGRCGTAVNKSAFLRDAIDTAIVTVPR